MYPIVKFVGKNVRKIVIYIKQYLLFIGSGHDV